MNQDDRQVTRRAASARLGWAAWWLLSASLLLAPAPSALVLAQDAEAPAQEQAPSPETTTEDEAPTEDEPPAQDEAPSQPQRSARDGQRFQDWTLRCRQPDTDAPELCEMFQRHVDEQGNVVLHAVIGKLPNNPNPGFLIILPLGISLPPGTFMQIDDGEVAEVPVERCVAQGCRVELLLDDNLSSLLKAGRQATVGFHAYDREGQVQRVDIAISLLGFTAALSEVLK